MNKALTRIAVLVPCFNEELTIASVVKNFKYFLPNATIYVFDNNSTDDTINSAIKAGALVSRVPMQGKGNVIRRMFSDIEAEVYLLVDGDNTYEASAAPNLVSEIIQKKQDMAVGIRVSNNADSYRSGHRFGNFILTKFVEIIFGHCFTDMLSGYRAFSRRYVKSFPAASSGFEIETEFTVHALNLRMPSVEVPTQYGARPEGSSSKLNTYRDGVRILITILKLFGREKPLVFFSILFFINISVSTMLSIPILETYAQTGLVPRLPTAILCSALFVLGTVLLVCGIILDSVTKGRTELKHLAYLAVSNSNMSSANENQSIEE